MIATNPCVSVIYVYCSEASERAEAQSRVAMNFPLSVAFYISRSTQWLYTFSVCLMLCYRARRTVKCADEHLIITFVSSL